MEFRGSITQRLISLSTLRSGGHPPPRKTRFPAAGPALPDGIGYPQGFNERFHIEMILLSRAFVAQGRGQFCVPILIATRFPSPKPRNPARREDPGGLPDHCDSILDVLDFPSAVAY